MPRIAAYHHEKMDGTGPFGIAAADIPLAARIIAVADVFDALMSPRRYKAAMSPLDALAVLERGAGRNWDAHVVAALREAWPDVLTGVYGMTDVPELPASEAAPDADGPEQRAA